MSPGPASVVPRPAENGGYFAAIFRLFPSYFSLFRAIVFAISSPRGTFPLAHTSRIFVPKSSGRKVNKTQSRHVLPRGCRDCRDWETTSNQEYLHYLIYCVYSWHSWSLGSSLPRLEFAGISPSSGKPEGGRDHIISAGVVLVRV
jgi:hypothetical protein